MDAHERGSPLPPSSLVKNTINFPDAKTDCPSDPEDYLRRCRDSDFSQYGDCRMSAPCLVERRFRHSGWETDRVRVLQSLWRTCMPANRLRRFCCCGGGSVVEHSRTADHHRIKAFFCGDRFCVPCAAARSRNVQTNLLDWTKNEKTYFLTFTLRNVETTVAAMLTRLIESFAKVRESLLWRVNVKGGAYMVEIKRGEGSGLWHIHLHSIVVGGCPDQIDLRRLWKDVTRDSHMVDVQESWSREKCCFYAAKYATKGWTPGVVRCPEDLDECVRALRGRRLLGTFGCWRKRSVERENSAVTDWRVVGNLRDVFASCVAGEPWALGVFQSLGLDAALVDGNPVFTLAGGVARASPRPARRR